MPQRDPYLAALKRVEDKVDQVSVQVADHEKKLRWIVSVALLVVGAIGGPDAVSALGGV